MQISAKFDSGNIEVLDASDPANVRLAIRRDHQSDFYQWFYFRVSGAKGQACRLVLTNAGGAAYAPGWTGYQACTSADLRTWTRVASTSYDGKELVIAVTPSADVQYFAYFAPYDQVRHARLVARSGAAAGVRTEWLGATLDGRDLDLLQVGEAGPGKRAVWVIARQHPGESMAEWWMEGFLGRLLDGEDAVAREVRARAVLYVVPNMNPDGSARGHLRTNAAGANLNREWAEPTAERSPEVLLVRNKMDETGVDFCLDVHGDEELPYNFIAGPEGVRGLSAEVKAQLKAFKANYMLANPDFQTVHGYGVDPEGEANMTMCTNAVAGRFGCLSMTLEMPFKDTVDSPDLAQGWSPGRSKRLGASALDPILSFLRG